MPNSLASDTFQTLWRRGPHSCGTISRTEHLASYSMKNTATITTFDISQRHIVLSYFQKWLNPSGNLGSAYRNSLQPLLYPSVNQPTAPSASCTRRATVLWRTNPPGNLTYLCPLPVTLVSPAGISQATPRGIFFLF